ncbi:hypothetical protein FGO68_gene2661 [Halteria grandinella]|uniref:Uncharacterized protein n=1 Tax=Halteria grandinella TaxID=5974 RepID=A0A8J8P554_HALGN|nr:hypothetical protein FGO68_gene2661 [Halteria grandinella]
MKCFDVHKYHLPSLEQQMQLRLEGKMDNVSAQRSFREVRLFIKLLRLELRICAKDSWNVGGVRKSLQKVHRQIFEYVQSEDYEDAPIEQFKGSSGAFLKGLWHFNKDMLMQNLLYLTGRFYHLRLEELKGKRIKILGKARKYYLKSFSSSLIKFVDQKLMKKAIKKLMQFPLHQNVDKLALPLILSKYYVKHRTVMVILELCNEDRRIHEHLLNFVIAQVNYHSI